MKKLTQSVIDSIVLDMIPITQPPANEHETHRFIATQMGIRIANWLDSDGRITPNSPVSLKAVDRPKTVLTEWQIQGLKDAGFGPSSIDRIQSILSSPEPQKWEPKEGEVCLFRSGDENMWMALRFQGMNQDGRYKAHGMRFPLCRPFDPSLIGTTDNP